MEDLNRREFLRFLGYSSAATLLTPHLGFSESSFFSTIKNNKNGVPFDPLNTIISDEVRLASGFITQRVLTEGDVINSKGECFGTDADFNAYFTFNKKNSSDGILWTNHENFSPLFVNANSEEFYTSAQKSKEQVTLEQGLVGGSLVRIQQDASGKWAKVNDDSFNRRVSGKTKIPLISKDPIMGSRVAMGTLANCAGGKTPWNTVLTCEENYHMFYGEAIYGINGSRTIRPSYHGWEKHYNYPPEHYGWVVEIDPFTGDAKKLTSLGRFAHEGATVRQATDGRCVVYLGDDTPNQCLYKFIADKPGTLETGTLYVAQLSTGRWIPLNLEKNPALKETFKSDLEILIRTREAAALSEGTPLDRPEDIEIDPHTGAVLVALTNNKLAGNYYGSILKIEESYNDPFALTFTSSEYLAGGPDAGFACPDNMVFDRLGNLWMTTDMSGSEIGQGGYKPFGNNSLFYIPMEGENAGKPFRVASAPMDAEFTGPTFSADGRTLFLSVQHPGEESRKLNLLTSHWPLGGNKIPRSAVIAVNGTTMDRVLGF